MSVAIPERAPPGQTAAAPEQFPPVLGWPRLRVMLILSVAFAVVHYESQTAAHVWFMRNLTVAMFATLGYGLFERWPRTLPANVERLWLQVAAVVLAGWFGAAFAYALPVGGDLMWVLHDEGHRNGLVSLMFACLLIGPPLAYAAVMRRREAQARDEAARLLVDRARMERQAADTRLRLLQAQVQPHFLFNTLANIRALVNAGSPRAVHVMDSLIAYLRASVPRLQQAEGSIAQELDLVRAYLELMHMRMPDRLHFRVECDADAGTLRCPPMALLTLVENAVRHGIDPSEEGGRIDVEVLVREGRCIACVADTGVGLVQPGSGGSGLANLRERMTLAFTDSRLSLAGNGARGTRAVLDFPAEPLP